ncbi:prepilin peptidase [Nonomuraea sediminis]|uniref:prepilin peptidase n=1 Tax=Nonomuraea sediminis TaxID=2835864 RepID=UPI001BDD433B|nr:A24 family peptidase [Nonomuraea sediminis]
MVIIAAVLGLVLGRYLRTFVQEFQGTDPVDGEFRRAVHATVHLRPTVILPPTMEVATGLVLALVAWRAGLPYLLFAVIGLVLAVIDWRTTRLPDAITLPAYPLVALTLLPTGELGRGLLGGAALAAVYGCLWVLRPQAMGLGDAKLAGLIGLACATLSWQAWLAAAFWGQLLGALYAVGLLVSKRGDRKTQFPFGPFMLLGALAGLCLG